MSSITEIFHDWRYPAAAIFVGSILGDWIFRILPVPRDAAEHFERMGRARLMGGLLDRVGESRLSDMADAVGIAEAAAICFSLRRQKRICLTISLAGSAVTMLIAFSYLPTTLVPDWVFAAVGIAGVYFLYRRW